MVTPKLFLNITPSDAKTEAGLGTITITEKDGVTIHAEASRPEVVIKEQGNTIRIQYADVSIMSEVKVTIVVKAVGYESASVGVLFTPNIGEAPRLQILKLSEKQKALALTLGTKMQSEERLKELHQVSRCIQYILENYYPIENDRILHPQDYFKYELRRDDE